MKSNFFFSLFLTIKIYFFERFNRATIVKKLFTTGVRKGYLSFKLEQKCVAFCRKDERYFNTEMPPRKKRTTAASKAEPKPASTAAKSAKAKVTEKKAEQVVEAEKTDASNADAPAVDFDFDALDAE